MYTNNSDVLKPHLWKTPTVIPGTNTRDDQYVIITTKDQTLGDPAQRKTLKKIYITHKGTGTRPDLKFISNNEGTERDTTSSDSSGTFASSGVMTTTAFTPSNATHSNNKYSYQVKIKGDADPSFVINDINLVYRDKTLK
jgi:hypothetical protein